MSPKITFNFLGSVKHTSNFRTKLTATEVRCPGSHHLSCGLTPVVQIIDLQKPEFNDF